MTPFDESIPYLPSPHWSSRGDCQIAGTVVHYTGTHGNSAIQWAIDPDSRVSWHFHISRSGDIMQQLDLEKAAWHCGVGEMKYMEEMRSNPNLFTIGIELANLGALERRNDGAFLYRWGTDLRVYYGDPPLKATLIYDTGHEVDAWWEPYQDEQIEALSLLLDMLAVRGYETRPIVGHEEIAMPMGRKRDPGPAFPWSKFGRAGGDRRTWIRVT